MADFIIFLRYKKQAFSTCNIHLIQCHFRKFDSTPRSIDQFLLIFSRHFSEETLESAGRSLHHLVTFFVIYMGYVNFILWYHQRNTMLEVMLVTNTTCKINVHCSPTIPAWNALPHTSVYMLSLLMCFTQVFVIIYFFNDLFIIS